jgi:hypothetical protein
MADAKHPLLYLIWHDHAAVGGWEDVSKFHGPSVVHSVGWLFREDKAGLTLAACYSPEGGAKEHMTSNLQFILKSCIVHRQTLRGPKRKT